MKTVSPALLTLLFATDHFCMADLYTFTLLSGTSYYWTTADIDTAHPGYLWSKGPRIERSSVKWKIGIEVDTLEIKIYPLSTDLIDGVPFLTAVQRGAFDGANVMLERAFMPTWNDLSAGTVLLFGGRVAGIDAGSETVINVNSHLELLDIKLPKNLYTTDCGLSLYEPLCGVSKAAFTFTGTVGAGATITTIPVTGLSAYPDGYFSKGIMSLAGGTVRRAVKAWASNALTLSVPLFSVPAAGDPITLLAGCDKTFVSCQGKFVNSLRFRGFPFIPRPDTVV